MKKPKKQKVIKSGLSKDRIKNRKKNNTKGYKVSDEKKKKYGKEFLIFLTDKDKGDEREEVKKIILADKEKAERNQYYIDAYEIIKERRKKEIEKRNQNYLCEAENEILREWSSVWFKYYCIWREENLCVA